MRMQRTFFAMMKRLTCEEVDRAAKWTVEQDTILNAPNEAELAAMRDPERWRLHFRYVLCSEDGLEVFRTFMKKIVALENIDFWIACQRLEDVESDPVQLEDACEKIFKRYVRTSAPKSINVSADTRSAVESAMKAKKFSRFTFAIAQRDIYDLMKSDSYPRFLQSSILTHAEKTWGSSKTNEVKDRSSRRHSTDAPPSDEKAASKKHFFSFRRSKRHK
mmetsp:Transcript_29469/g.88242  ORF Transcript_29469/g.88242 Transcript_29469/m.88242 type:complete len:219 (+) Transcript_29469:1826-2482(+)